MVLIYQTMKIHCTEDKEGNMQEDLENTFNPCVNNFVNKYPKGSD